ncbi:hypothetical protein GCM10023097_16440 [Streptomyces collinus]
MDVEDARGEVGAVLALEAVGLGGVVREGGDRAQARESEERGEQGREAGSEASRTHGISHANVVMCTPRKTKA